MKQIIFIALFLLISCEENQQIETIKNPNVYSIGFGSCLTQERSIPIFNTIKAENYDLFSTKLSYFKSLADYSFENVSLQFSIPLNI